MPGSSVGVPRGGYDIIVDGVNTRIANRTTSLTKVISVLNPGRHCFAVNARYTGIAPVLAKRSNEERCVTVE
jgi:hypothetical protein